jgi:hypothetical protein
MAALDAKPSTQPTPNADRPETEPFRQKVKSGCRVEILGLSAPGGPMRARHFP